MSAVLAPAEPVLRTPGAVRAQRFDIRPVAGAAGALGAEVVGLDLSQPVSAADFERLQQAHWTHHVLVFRDQRITPAQHVAFSRLWGPLQIHVLRKFHLPGHPEILVVSNIRNAEGEPEGLGDAGQLWHSDLSYKPVPSLGSLLHAQELQAEHSYLLHYETLRAKSPWRPALTQAQIDEVEPAVHPVVQTHPGNGRKALFVSEHFTARIVGLPEDESRDLLRQLFRHSVQPQFVYRHPWQPHDIVFWDNRSVLHLAAGTPEQLRRRLHRTTVEGAKPVA